MKVITQQLLAEITGQRKFRALITQSGTNAPTNVKVLENTIGEVTWSYDSIGSFFLNSDALFTEGHTFLPMPSVDICNPVDGEYFLRSGFVNENTLLFALTGLEGNVTNGLNLGYVEVIVYDR